ncbi:Hypothetical protein D9617_12g037410 [Elsinoe fawcettii]|nr:Hypothetical protein D9617_12g037410 [Elsinoe fawcettii]
MDAFNAGIHHGLTMITKMVVASLTEAYPTLKAPLGVVRPFDKPLSPAGSFPFLDLPAELRHIVYEHAVDQTSNTTDSLQPGITAASRQIRSESIDLYFRQSTVPLHFNFSPICLSKLQVMHAPHVAPITSNVFPTLPDNIYADAKAQSPFLTHAVLDNKLPGYDLPDGIDYLLDLQQGGKSLPTRIQFPVAWAVDGLTTLTLMTGVEVFDPTIARLVLTVAYSHATGDLKLESIEEICETAALAPVRIIQHRYTLLERADCPTNSLTFFEQTNYRKPARAAILAPLFHDTFLPMIHMVNTAVPRSNWSGIKSGEARRLTWMIQLIGALQSSVHYEFEMMYYFRVATGAFVPFAHWD